MLADENTADRLLIEDMEQAMATEAPPPATDVDRLYAEAGIVLPDSVARRFDEVRRFHASIVDNRRSHLSGEVRAAERRIAERERKQAELDQHRARIVALLRAHGALEQLTQLQSELSRVLRPDADGALDPPRTRPRLPDPR